MQTIQTGLFPHHVVTYYTENGYCYYKEYFGTGWHKRKIDKNGFIKFQNCLMMNPDTKELISRYDYEKGAIYTVKYGLQIEKFENFDSAQIEFKNCCKHSSECEGIN